MDDSFRKILIGTAVVLLVLITGAAWVISEANESRTDLPVYHLVTDFQLTDSSNNLFGKEDLLGKVSVVDFIFTRCQGPCPTMSGFMEGLYQKYSNLKDLQFISITIDPDYDTPDILRQYAVRYNVTDNRWKFLYGDINYTAGISEEAFLIPADPRQLPMGHSTRFVLVDRQGQIRGFYSGTDESSIASLEADLPFLFRSAQ